MAQALITATIATLRRYAPFDDMEPEGLAFLAARAQVGYYARGERIAGPEDGPADRLRIVRQGRVRRTNDAVELTLGPGECFPIAALIGRQSAVYGYEAEQDCFCWEIGAGDFQRLLELSPRFHAFCSNHLAVLVERSHRALRAEAGQALLDSAGMLAPLRAAASRAPVGCTADTPVGEVLKTMHAARVGSMVVLDAAQAPVGIFTQPDVLERVALPQVALHTPIGELMTRDPVSLEEERTLADAAIAMARHGIRHVIITRDGRFAGVVSERDLFALQRASLARTAQRIRMASSVGELAEAAAQVRSLARHLLAHGVSAEPLTAMVSALNDALTQQLIAMVEKRHPLEGRWCWIALGSEGRMEQTFATDQDNGLIYAGGGQHELIDFADEVNRGLAAVGFPLCRGDIMARNPRWCLSLEQWRAQFDDWIRNPVPAALMNAAIFFDLRALAGDAALAGALREGILAQTRSNAAFQRALAASAVEARPPLGLLRDFQADEIDLKGHGARLFVDAARVLALAHGDGETSTAARLRRAGEPAAADAFHHIQALRLRIEGNRLRVGDLNDLDRRVLKEALRQCGELQQRLRLDYAL